MARAGRAPRDWTWFFDLDDTLHDASYRIYRTIDGTMNAYIAHHLAVPAEDANRLRRDYWRRYGATLLGLVRHHDVDPYHFLDTTHAFAQGPELAGLIRHERGLARHLARLPGRKVLLTNAPAHYADAVLQRIGLSRQIARRYAIEQMRLHGRFRPKPSRAMLRMLVARERVHPSRCVLVEDSLPNLRSARAVGVRTVLVNGHVARAERTRIQRPRYVDLQVKSISQLVMRAGSLR